MTVPISQQRVEGIFSLSCFVFQTFSVYFNVIGKYLSYLSTRVIIEELNLSLCL